MDHLLNKLIYHKFYHKYGYITKVNLYCDLTQNNDIGYTAHIKWKDDGSGVSLPSYSNLDHVEIADFKHFIKKANEQNDGKN